MNNPFSPPKIKKYIKEEKNEEDTQLAHIYDDKLNEIHKSIRIYYVLSIMSSLIAMIINFLSGGGGDMLDYVEPLFIFLLAIGIVLKSRIAAVIMLVYFVVSKIYIIQTNNLGIIAILLAFVFGYYYYKGTVACFEWHRKTILLK